MNSLNDKKTSEKWLVDSNGLTKRYHLPNSLDVKVIQKKNNDFVELLVTKNTEDGPRKVEYGIFSINFVDALLVKFSEWSEDAIQADIEYYQNLKNKKS